MLPRMKMETEFYPLRLALRLPGSDLRREEVFTSSNPFRKSKLVSHVDTFDVCGGGQHLSIIPARPVEFDVFTLTSPPRLVVDVILSRMDPMREEKKLSLRTLPLHGDQICFFLEEAAEAGVTPRVLADDAGNVFGRSFQSPAAPQHVPRPELRDDHQGEGNDGSTRGAALINV